MLRLQLRGIICGLDTVDDLALQIMDVDSPSEDSVGVLVSTDTIGLETSRDGEMIIVPCDRLRREAFVDAMNTEELGKEAQIVITMTGEVVQDHLTTESGVIEVAAPEIGMWTTKQSYLFCEETQEMCLMCK